jgi:predicted dehydrogenase
VDILDIVLLFTVHSLADHLKATNKFWYKRFDSLKGGLLIDQLIHVLQIIVFMAMN